MICQHCHVAHDDVDNFCAYCGTPLAGVIVPQAALWRIRWTITETGRTNTLQPGPWIHVYPSYQRRCSIGDRMHYTLEVEHDGQWITAEQWRGWLLTQEGAIG